MQALTYRLFCYKNKGYTSHITINHRGIMSCTNSDICVAMNERRRPYKSVFVSPEIKHQIEDSGASIIIWQDTLYENVERTEAKLDKVILANITDYLPWLKRFLGSSVLRAVYQMMAAPPCEIYEREGFY